MSSQWAVAAAQAFMLSMAFCTVAALAAFNTSGEPMRIVWVIVGALVGLVIGAVLGFGAALIAMSFSKSHNDGSYGMREMIVCLPSGAVLGLVAGVLWGLTTSLAGG
jgi:hypothetical protein